MHGMAEHRRERRLERACSIAIERDVSDAEIAGQFEFVSLRREAAVAAVELEPTSAAKIPLCASLSAERLVLGNGAGH
jgi:hypothetical protein